MCVDIFTLDMFLIFNFIDILLQNNFWKCENEEIEEKNTAASGRTED